MRRKIKVIIFIILLFLISNIAYGNYITIISGKAIAKLKSSIFISNSDTVAEGNISSIENNYYENTFNVLNYIDENNLVNEINFEYTIRILPSTNNFPVRYTLIDLEKNKELELNSKLETTKLTLGTNKKSYKYKLIIEWDMENNNKNLEENLDVEILVKGVQVK